MTGLFGDFCDALYVLGWLVGEGMLKATLLLIPAFVLHAFLAKRHPLACSAAWNACLAGLLLLPVGMLWLPEVSTRFSINTLVETQSAGNVSTANEGDISSLSPLQRTSTDLPRTNDVQNSIVNGDTTSVATPLNHDYSFAQLADNLPAWIGAVYALGLFVMLARFLASLNAVHRLCHSAQSVDHAEWHVLAKQLAGRLGVRGDVALCESEQVSVPVVAGLSRPSILLPNGMLTQVSDSERDAILLHELAHVRRADYAWQLIMRFVQVLYWLNPFIWVAGILMSRVREQSCDAYCVYAMCSKDTYLNSLATLAGRMGTRRGAVVGLAVVRPSRIQRRLETIRKMTPSARCVASAKLRLASVAVVVLAAVGVGTLAAGGEDAPPSIAGDTTIEDNTPKVGQGEPNGESTTASTRNRKLTRSRTDSLQISGQVLGPEGKPFAGANIFVHAKSLMGKAPKTKDPSTKVFESEVADGKPRVRVVHPRLREVFRQYGFDPDNMGPETQDELERNREALQAFRKVMAGLHEPNPYHFPETMATSDSDGHFSFDVATTLLKEPYEDDANVIAVADGYGPAWMLSKERSGMQNVVLRLRKDLPIKGRIVDDQGRPVTGATVRMGTVFDRADNRAVEVWTETVEAYASGNTQRFNELFIGSMSQFPGGNLGVIPRSIVTDDEGRFTINGIGINRVVFRMKVSGPGIGSDEFSVLTRPGPGVIVRGGSRNLRRSLRTYGPVFEHPIASTRPIVGTVRDMATGKPLQGIQVAAFGPAYVDDFTDEQGKYQLAGLPFSDSYKVTAWPFHPQSRRPYPNTTKYVEVDKAQNNVPVNFDLVRGVVLHGTVVAKPSGRPVTDAQIRYAAYEDNAAANGFAFAGSPKSRDNPLLVGIPQLRPTNTQTDSGGKFSMVVLAGKGAVSVTVPDGPFVLATSGDAALRATVPHLSDTSSIHGLKTFNVSSDEDSIEFVVELHEGKSLTGTIIGPDGEQLKHVRVYGQHTYNFRSIEPLESSQFAVTGLAAGRKRLLVFRTEDGVLGAIREVDADTVGPLEVHLAKCGSLTGRLFDKSGKPLQAKAVMARIVHSASEPVVIPNLTATTDREGRFRIDGIVSGTEYKVLGKEILVEENGKMLDLGDIPTDN